MGGAGLPTIIFAGVAVKRPFENRCATRYFRKRAFSSAQRAVFKLLSGEELHSGTQHGKHAAWATHQIALGVPRTAVADQ